MFFISIINSYFRFNILEMETHSKCRYDYVAVYDGPLINKTDLLGRYCGNQTSMPPILKSVSNQMTVQFRTDRTVSGAGFKAVSRFTYGPLQVDILEIIGRFK